jgi:hypothetical protein
LRSDDNLQKRFGSTRALTLNASNRESHPKLVIFRAFGKVHSMMEKKMKRLATVPVLLCLLFVTAPAVPTVHVSAAFASSLTDTWLSLRSRNFFLVGNASEREMRRVAVRLEQFRHAFSQLASRASFDSPVPTTVIVFKNDSSFRPYKPLYNNRPASLAGLFQSGDDMNYIALAVGGSSVGNDPFAIIFHEYVHLLTRNNISSVRRTSRR